jgi:pyridoxamine 5'-phosphate oxidase
MKNIADIRTEYSRETLSEKSVSPNPFFQFEKWFHEALSAEVPEPNAMAFATSVNGRPSARIVLLKGYDSRGFVFYTNTESKKGVQLASNPFAAMTFFWHPLERQVRIEGRIEKVSEEESDAYYRSRPLGSRIGAWASPQSREISREELDNKYAEYKEKFEGNEPNRPPYWGGYRLVPDMLEFWQGRPSRLHDRILYLLEGEKWVISRLAP